MIKSKEQGMIKDLDHINSHEITGVIARIIGLSNLLDKSSQFEEDKELIVCGLYNSAKEIKEINSKINQIYSDILLELIDGNLGQDIESDQTDMVEVIELT